MDIYETLQNRIPAKATAGKAKVIRKVLETSRQLKDAIDLIERRDDLSTKGRAQLLDKQVQVTGATLRRAQRQLDYHDTALAKGRDNLAKKVIGEAKPTDAEWRTMLRQLPIGERTQLAMQDPEARAAVLRAPAALSDMPADRVALMLAEAVQTVAPDDHARLVAHQEAQGVHVAAVRMLQQELLKVPFIVDTDGKVRRPSSQRELDTYLDETVPAPHQNAILLEQVEIDATE